jgi:hypothetical protein
MKLVGDRYLTARLLLASFHQEPVPSHVIAARSCAQVTRPGTAARGHPLEKGWVQKEKNEEQWQLG